MNLQTVLTMASLYAAPKIASYLTSPPSNTNQRTMSAFEKFRKSASEFSKATINTIGEHNWIILTDFISDNAWMSYGLYSTTCPSIVGTNLLKRKILLVSLYLFGVGVCVFVIRLGVARMIHPCCPNFAKWITPRHFPIAPNRSISNGNSVSSNNNTVTNATNLKNIGNIKAEEEFVPEEFENDRLLNQYKCPITHRVPMRPVSDPTTGGKIFYARQAASDWLYKSRLRSPMTRKVLVPILLREDFTVTELIKWRVDFLTKVSTATASCFEPTSIREKSNQNKVAINEFKLKLLKEQIEHLNKIIALFDEEIPQLYHSDFTEFICPITKFPIRKVVALDINDEESIYYERKAIETFIREKPDQIPNQWPVDLFPLPLRMELLTRSSCIQRIIDRHVNNITKNIAKIAQELQSEVDGLEASTNEQPL